MANNTLIASDNFASGSLAAGWTNIPTLSVCQVTGTPKVTEVNVAGTAAGQMWNALGALKEQCSEVTINALAGGNAGTAIVLCARVQSGGTFSAYTASAIANGTWQISRFDAGTQHVLASGTMTFAVGDVISLQVAGSSIAFYQNFSRLGFIGDATYTSGFPGYFQQANASVANCKVSSWRGYNTNQQDGVWAKQGAVIVPISGDLQQGLNNATVLYEGNAQILSGTVFKAWVGSAGFATAGNIFYFESTDGLTWSRKASAVVASRNIPMIFKNGSTYNLYCQNNTVTNGVNSFSLYTSTDGVTFSNQTDSIIGLGGAGTWDHSLIFNFAVVDIISGTWYALYSGTNNSSTQMWSVGLATSSDGVTWTKYGGNPVITGSLAVANSGCIAKVGSKYYMWAQSNPGGLSTDSFHPTSCYRYFSADLINWTADTHSVNNSEMFQSVNATTGQCFGNSILAVGGQTYMFSTSANSDVSNAQVYQISVATTPAPSISSLVNFTEDAVSQVSSDNFTSGTGDLSANWTLPTGGTKLQIVSGPFVEPTATSVACQAVYTNSSFSANQYSQITIHTLSGTLNQSIVAPMVLSSTAALTDYEGRIASPTGTSDASASIWKRVANVQTQLGPTVTADPQVGDVWRLTVVTGSDGFPVLSLYQNGFLIVQAQDTSSTPITSGSPGILAYATVAVGNAQIASWAGGNSNVVPPYVSSGQVGAFLVGP